MKERENLEKRKFEEFIRDLKLNRINFTECPLRGWELDFYKQTAIERGVSLKLVNDYFQLKIKRRKKCPIEFSEKIKEARERLGMTTTGLAQEVGCCYKTMADYEKRTKNANVVILKKVVEILKIDVDLTEVEEDEEIK